MPQEITWEPRIISTYLEDWMLLVILVTIVLVAIVRVKNSTSFTTLTTSIFTKKTMAKESAGQIGWTDTEKIILLAIYFLSSSLFFTLILHKFFPNLTSQSSSIAFFELFVLINIVVYFFKLGILSFIQLIIGRYQMISEYSFSIGQSNRFLGVLFIPLCILIVIYSKSEVNGLLYFGLFSLGIVYSIRVIRIIINSLKIEGGIFYIILYLCAFEFLPFLITFHFMKMILKG